MQKAIIFLINFYFIFNVSQLSFAGGAVEAQKRQMMQRRAYEEAVKQKIYQEAIAKRQMQVEQAKRAAYQQAVGQKIAQQQVNAYHQAVSQAASRAAANQQQQQMNAYRIALAKRQQAIAQQQAAAVAGQAQAYQQLTAAQAAQQKRMYGQLAASSAALGASADLSSQAAMDRQVLNQMGTNLADEYNPNQFDPVFEEPDEIVDIQDIWKELETSSEAWPMMMDMAPKVATIEKYKDFYKQQGVEITKSPEHYIEFIDGLIMQNPTFLQNRFEDLFRLAAIMEYDFDNGVDKNELARRVLGDQIYEQNRKRLGK